MLDYYNDFDPGATEWLRTLMAEAHIPPGRVDGRSILDVSPDDLAGVRRAHFFAGIAGWSEALRLADWPDSIPVWTGSPPCQPFSPAGKGLGRDDPRHLGPRFVELVRAGRPPVLFGEQVASSDVFGPAAGSGKRGRPAEPVWAWIDDLFDRLEAAGYAAWALDIPAAGIGAPHIRQRCFFAAVDLRFAGGLGDEQGFRCQGRDALSEPPAGGLHVGAGSAGGLGDGIGAGLEGQRGHGDASREPGRVGALAAGSAGAAGVSGGLGLAAGERCDGLNLLQGWLGELLPQVTGPCAVGRVADSGSIGRDGRQRAAQRREHDRADAGRIEGHDGPVGFGEAGDGSRRSRPTNGFWGAADWLACRDGSWRPVEPGTFPLAHGVSGRVGLLRGYGNAIVPQVAAEAIAIAREVMIETGIWDSLRAAYQPEAAE